MSVLKIQTFLSHTIKCHIFPSKQLSVYCQKIIVNRNYKISVCVRILNKILSSKTNGVLTAKRDPKMEVLSAVLHTLLGTIK